MITIIAAMSKNRVIGLNNALPWHNKEDLARFYNLTKNSTVVMGRKTFDNIGFLKERENVVLSRTLKDAGISIFSSIEELLKKKKSFFCIGGGQIFKQMIRYADKIELTIIDKDIKGDTFFPHLDNSWSLSNKIQREGFSFDTFIRNKS